MKILYVTTIGSTMGFFKSFISDLVKAGHTVDIACNDKDSKVPELYTEIGCNIYTISCTRSPINKGTLKAISEIKKLVSENKYDIVHCHTPIAAMCTRLACKKLRKKKDVKVIYTAHGFHFYEGAPKKNWLMYYPIEKICSHFTDALITINKEDYDLAKRKMKAKSIDYVPGVGIDVQKFADTVIDRAEKRRELGVPEDAFLLLSVGELNENKNHKTVIRALALLGDKNIHYAIAGKGELHDEIINLANELGIADRVHLLGFRKDVAELYKAADCFVHPSFREGLPVSIMEAMASGLPIVASEIRGCVDLVDNSSGRLFDAHSVDSCKNALNEIVNGDISKAKESNSEKAAVYSTDVINSAMKKIYNTVK